MRLKQELHIFKEQAMQGPFRVGVLPATMALTSILSVPFAGQAPALQLSIETLEASQLLHKVRQGELDVAMTQVDEVPLEGVSSHLLYRERMFFFTADQSCAGPRATWEEVLAGPLCLLRSSLPSMMERRLQSASSVLYTDSTAVLAAHVASGRWSTVLPQSLAMYLQPSPELHAFAFGKEEEQANIGFISTRLNPLPPAVHAWIELAHTPEMVEAIRRMLKAHEPYLLKKKPVRR